MARLFSDEEIQELADKLGLDFSGDYEVVDENDEGDSEGGE